MDGTFDDWWSKTVKTAFRGSSIGPLTLNRIEILSRKGPKERQVDKQAESIEPRVMSVCGAGGNSSAPLGPSFQCRVLQTVKNFPCLSADGKEFPHNILVIDWRLKLARLFDHIETLLVALKKIYFLRIRRGAKGKVGSTLACTTRQSTLFFSIYWNGAERWNFKDVWVGPQVTICCLECVFGVGGGGGIFHGHVQFYLLNQLRVEIEYFSFGLNVPWKYIDKLVRLQ